MMMRTAVTLLFALGASAEAPHWVQKKSLSSIKVPSVASIIKPYLKMRAQQKTPNNRRLQAIMSEECTAACPGVPAFIEAMMAAAAEGSERRLDGHEMDAKQMQMMCDHMEALKCAGETAACQDTGEPQSAEDAEGMAGMECMCACPKLVEMAGDTAKMCEDKAGTVGCITSNAACSAMAKDVNEKEVDLMCEYTAAGCQKKSEEMGTCVGETKLMQWTEAKCDDDMSADTATCCPIGKALVDCITADCMTMQIAMQKMQADGGDAEAKESMADVEKQRKACPDAGLPSEAAVSATASAGKVSSGAAADAADFATPGQTVSMLAMASVIAAALMA